MDTAGSFTRVKNVIFGRYIALRRGGWRGRGKERGREKDEREREEREREGERERGGRWGERSQH